MEENIIRIARMQAWARAKGELDAMLSTFFQGSPADSEGQFDALKEQIDIFVKHVENHGLYE